MISKHRFRIQQCFGTMKRLFGLHRARYFGGAKTHAQMVMAAISQNLLKAANKITLNPQTFAIDTLHNRLFSVQARHSNLGSMAS